MLTFELEPISFAILQRHPNRNAYYYQEVADAHLVIPSNDLPLSIELVVHRLVDAQGYPLESWRVSDRKTGAAICKDELEYFDRDRSIQEAIDFLNGITALQLHRCRKRIKEFKRQAKRLSRQKIKRYHH